MHKHTGLVRTAHVPVLLMLAYMLLYRCPLEEAMDPVPDLVRCLASREGGLDPSAQSTGERCQDQVKARHNALAI